MSKQKSSNSGAFRAFVLTLVILILAVAVTAAMTQGFTNWNPYGWFDELNAEKTDAPEADAPEADTPKTETPAIEGEIQNSAHVKLAMSAATTSAEGSKSVTLTATVLPVDAPDKSVDWSVEWDVAPTYGENPVTDYVTVTPQSDGSNVATVTCLQGFGADTITVTVTTRVGGYFAECSLSYAGLPTSLEITVTGADTTYDEGWGLDLVKVYCGTTYNWDLSLDNELHYVGENFEPSYSYSVAGVGSFNYNYTQKIGISGTPTTEQGVCNFSPDSPVDMGILEDLVTVSFDTETATLSVTPNMTVASYYIKEYFDSHRSWGEYQFTSYTDSSKVPYIQVTVTENNTGLSASVKLQLNSVVTGVSLDSSSIVF